MKTKILLILLLISNNLFSQKIENEKIDDFLTYVKDNNGGIGSISIYKDGKELYSRSFGQDKLPDVNFDIETKYQIASITKMVTAILIFDLIENNKLKLNDKLSDYYPEMPNSNKITIKNMLEHTSGLGDMAFKDGVFWLSDKVTENKFLDSINTEYTNKASNMGIFGCKDVSFSKQYSNNVFNFISSLDISDFDDYLNSLNIFIEQYYVFHLCTQSNFTYNTIHPDVEDYRSNVKGGFFNQPDSNNSFNHFLGNSKRYEDINDYVVKKLKEYYPDDYKRIEEITAKNISIEYYHMCDKNKFIDLDKINFEFNKKLNKFNINISTQFNDDFNTFYKTKHSYLDKISSNEFINIDKITILKKELWKDDNLNNFKIKFSNNVLVSKTIFILGI